MRTSIAVTWVLLLAMLTLLSVNVCAAQSGRNPADTQEQAPPEDEARARIERDMAKKANEQRHAEIKRDTERLLKLATELQQYVDKTNEHVLSLEVIKKADEIEKLAHSVREKMKGQN